MLEPKLHDQRFEPGAHDQKKDSYQGTPSGVPKMCRNKRAFRRWLTHNSPQTEPVCSSVEERPFRAASIACDHQGFSPGGRLLLAVIVLIFCALPVFAGGPAYVAGSGYDPGVKGHALVWASAHINYYTDQGDLSPILTNAQADTMVANAFASWTSVWGTSFTTSQGGHLAEDVNGANVIASPGGTISLPLDIQASATTTPVAIVYDNDGAVTDALLGAGAGGPDSCFTNAVYGEPDNFSSAGNIVHALVVINGVCAASTAKLPDVQYRLMRTLGRVIGLGWSQANLNAITHNPAPTSDDYEGLPLMHFSDSISCVPVSVCYPDAAFPKLDDAASLGRLYPSTTPPPTPTARIHGSVYFTDSTGAAVQPMQGVNVVARLLDSTLTPSRRYVVTSVSGFAFHGNAGNVVNGYVDDQGLRYDRWGSDDPALEGYFDLGGLIVPQGQSLALYRLSVEPMDASWSDGVPPYAFAQVKPSGQFAPVTVTVLPGSDTERDILMLGSEVAKAHPGSGATYANPATLPPGGSWTGWISGYADADWFQFPFQADRTASISVVALDESGQPTQSKLMPVVGIWQLSDATGGPAPAATPTAFNTINFAMSRLDAQFYSSETFRLGIADLRSDGRPDYSYTTNVLYSDAVTPSRISLAGGPVTLTGLGFRSSQQVTTPGGNAQRLSVSATQTQVKLPALALDGTATVVVTDPSTGGSSQMINAVTYGAASTDQLLMLQAAEPATPAGSQAPNPIRVRVVAEDGVTPVDGATVAWSTTNGTTLSVCGGAGSCSVLSDQSGESATWVTPIAAGQSTITAELAPLSYNPPQTKQATLVGTSSALDLAALLPTRRIAQGATLDLPLTAQVLSTGTPQANVVVNYALLSGSATLSAASGTTNSAGLASINAHLANHTADVQVSACVAPNNNPCQTFTMFATPPSLWKLELVSGSGQVVSTGQSFQPLVMRVTDGSAAGNPVIAASTVFNTLLVRLPPGSNWQDDGKAIVGGTSTPVVLGKFTSTALTAEEGQVAILPTAGFIQGPCDLLISVVAGTSTVQLHLRIVSAIDEDAQQPSATTTRKTTLWGDQPRRGDIR